VDFVFSVHCYLKEGNYKKPNRKKKSLTTQMLKSMAWLPSVFCGACG